MCAKNLLLVKSAILSEVKDSQGLAFGREEAAKCNQSMQFPSIRFHASNGCLARHSPFWWTASKPWLQC